MRTQATGKRLARIDRQLDDLISLERILASRAWGELERIVLEALRPYPEAREAVRAGCAAQVEREKRR